MKLLLTTLLILSSSCSAIANEFQPGYTRTRTCTRNEYREEYIPGTRNSPGYVKHWDETVEVPCGPKVKRIKKIQSTEDTNDCSEGTLAGGLLGGGLATAVSRGKDRWWAIPAGIVGGSMVGCEMDGG